MDFVRGRESAYPDHYPALYPIINYTGFIAELEMIARDSEMCCRERCCPNVMLRAFLCLPG